MLLVYRLAEHLLRSQLAETEQTVPNQINKPTKRPTMRWIFQCFEGIDLLHIQIGSHKQIRALNHFFIHSSCFDFLWLLNFYFTELVDVCVCGDIDSKCIHFSEHASQAVSRGSGAALKPFEKHARLAQPLRQNTLQSARIFTGADTDQTKRQLHQCWAASCLRSFPLTIFFYYMIR